MIDQINCVIVGDGLVGKTSMLSVLVNQTFPNDYFPPTVFDNFSSNLLVDQQAVLLNMYDTSGCEAYDRLRPMAYVNTDIFIVVFAVLSDVEHSNVVDKWIPEIRHHCPEVPFILVGNKTDLRESDAATETTDKRLKTLSKQVGERLAQQLGAVAYMECSARKQDGVTEVFEAAVRVVREQRSFHRRQR
ncbi:hypothetical protein CAPTEDRAFT_207146 [Capitella teleta]|uniref:Uncharacterized protein n=1 Tax=Capitella teleta TaxID=283909 RepID=R7T881_CAPTE|nr:hypothetical protein CAPTEDRAFT_207146 [Capitella teleta]|eukprot:ELT87174.1 hypothetical protein CAPTEDRAFT_207146 [Capitella teleta]